MHRSRRRLTPPDTNWDRVATWYDGWVGDWGSRYHRLLTIPAVLNLLEARPGEEILDIGAGQGVLAPHIVASGAGYTGIDASSRLISAARRRHGRVARFAVGDARELQTVRGVHGGSYDAAVFLMSIQDMDPLDLVLASAAWALRSSGRIVMLMTHPAFRQPRHSGWGFDETRKLQYRRVDAYLTPMAVPMKSLGRNTPTRAFHRPISRYVNEMAAAGFAVDAMLELPDLSLEVRPRPSKRRSARDDAEIPLFLGLRAVRPHDG
jgi:ubiquinone/menaquinone biosynthesis C-methylase UbiE